MENTFCVYCHTNKINNKKYYGQTKWGLNPERRWGKNGKGYIDNKHFWDAICKYGWDNFEHSIIKNNLSLEEANKLETELIIRDKTYDKNFGYNLDLGGNNNLLLDETKQKISLANKNPSKETRLKMSNAAKQRVGEKNAFYGKKHSEETKLKISMTKKENPTYGMKGKKHSEEAKKKMGEARRGVEPSNKGVIGVFHHTEITKQKISISQKKKWEDQDYKERCINSRIGKKRSDEFKRGRAERAKGNTNVRGMKWYNNGEINTRAFECPPGFVLGRCKKSK